ncbi:unnamed protein product [Nezara viridula]|uniref:Uncharacterized protein n=1 Tax=Nezara viridula TaxID=85310 RepID=A0A9P0EH20_NEZVI|nr:unnamed protein product [Nezara viridula]
MTSQSFQSLERKKNYQGDLTSFDQEVEPAPCQEGADRTEGGHQRRGGGRSPPQGAHRQRGPASQAHQVSFAHNDKHHKKEEKHDESPDFEDTPLVAAASSQSSRINVKKGPNGQEYEYEYVYYYYDDEDEEGKGGAKTDKPGVGKTERPDLQDEEPSPTPRQELKSHLKQDVRDQDKEEDIRQISRQELRDEPKNGRQEDLTHDGRQGSFRKEAKQDLRDEKRTDNLRQDTRDSFRQDYKEDNRQDLKYEGRQSSRSEGRVRDRQALDETRGGFEQRVEEPVRHRGGDTYEERRQEGRGRTRGQQQEAKPEEERRRRPVQPAEDNAAPARSRYPFPLPYILYFIIIIIKDIALLLRLPAGARTPGGQSPRLCRRGRVLVGGFTAVVVGWYNCLEIRLSNGHLYALHFASTYAITDLGGEHGFSLNGENKTTTLYSLPFRAQSYTTIERGRGKSSDIAVTTIEPSSNEVLPTRSPSRGRQPAAVTEEEERLPPNTRFPGRSRGSATTTEPPPSRSRGSGSAGGKQGRADAGDCGVTPRQAVEKVAVEETRGGGSVRRPSLVDSSSFRTHSSDAAPEEDQGGYLSSAVGDTRESDLEEYIRPTTFQPQSVPQTTLPPPQPSVAPSALPEENDQEMPAKAALDLYAILQQTQEENSVVDSDYGTTNIPTTDPPTTTPEPTTTPTTTTTTTTTTTPPPPPEPTKRGSTSDSTQNVKQNLKNIDSTHFIHHRFRSGGSRTRVRSQGGSTTTTTEATPEDEASQRPKFKPSHSRSPGQVSAYGRRRASAAAAATSTTTEATQQSTRARNNFQAGSGGNRTRGRVSTTPAPVEEEEPSEEAEPTSTTAKPRVRIGGAAGARPLRPGPRLNLRPLRPGASTTAAPAPASSEAPVEQEVATTPEAPAHSEGDALTKLRSRPRLKVQPVVPQTRPFNNQRRPLIGLNNRRRTTESEASAETTTQPTPVETETPPPSSTEPQPHTTENKLASLIGRRRPINRRLPIQQAGDH